MLADLVGVKDVSDFNVAILEVTNDVWACNLNLNYNIAPLDLLVVKIVHSTQI